MMQLSLVASAAIHLLRVPPFARALASAVPAPYGCMPLNKASHTSGCPQHTHRPPAGMLQLLLLLFRLVFAAPCCCCWVSSAAARQSMWKVAAQLLQLSMKRSMARLQQPQRLDADLAACRKRRQQSKARSSDSALRIDASGV
jgi:hypothetical protein